MVKLKGLSGVVESGLFVGMADVAYVGTTSAVERLERKSRV
jgi:ribose 5-phosphate isomerase